MTRFFLILALLIPCVANATDWLGNVPVGETINFNFNTLDASGEPVTIAGTPAIEVYEDGSTTQITAGTTLTEDFDSVTGLHNIAIVATGANGFEAGKYYSVVMAGTTPTADSVSILGRVLGRFRCVEAENVAGTPTSDATYIAGSAADIATDAEIATAVETEITDRLPTATTKTRMDSAFDANSRVDVGSVAGTAQTAGDIAALIVTADSVIDSIYSSMIKLGTSYRHTQDAVDTNNNTADVTITEAP